MTTGLSADNSYALLALLVSLCIFLDMFMNQQVWLVLEHIDVFITRNKILYAYMPSYLSLEINQYQQSPL